VIHAKKDASAVLVHRYVLEKSVGRKLRSDEQACHSCDRPECFEVSHLWVGTNAENTTDCVAKGRNVKGSRTGAALLNEKSVASIKMLLRGGTSQALCAALFGVSVSAIGAVKRGVNWGYIASDVSGASPLPKRRRIILKRRENPARGSAIGTAKLDEPRVAEIKRGLQSGETQMALADRYGVSQAVISKIKLGQSWSHVAA
jgi:uncharacterized protein YerC